MKRTLKQQVKYAEKEILESDKDFYNEFVAEHYPPKPKQYKRRVFIGAGSALAAVAAAILLLVFLLPNTTDEKKHYLLENERIAMLSIGELNEALQGITIEIDSKNAEVKRIYDIKYNDTLYYNISFSNEITFESVNIYVYVNPNFERQKKLESGAASNSINDIVFSYNKRVEDDDSGINNVKYLAITEKYNNTVIYIEHEQLSFTDESDFFDFFQNTIKKA